MTRISLQKAARDVFRAVAALDRSVDLDPVVAELVKLRASQLNGCAFCIDLHARAATDAGEDPRRIWAVAAWREAPFFDPRERAALALAEAMTLLPAGVSDEVYEEAAEHFPGDELGQLIGAIVAINAWNRVSVATRMQPPPLDRPRVSEAVSG